MASSPTAAAADKPSPAALIRRLAQLLHTSGMPAHELEERMEFTSSILGAPAHFFSTPTSLFIAFEGQGQSTHLIRVAPPSVNLDQMSQLHELLLSIERDQAPADEIWRQILAIESQPPYYGRVANVISFAAVGAAAAVFFGGGFEESAAACVIGLIVGLLVLVCSIQTPTRYLSDMLAALTATILANLAAWWLPGLATEVTILASLIILLPGLGVTVAVNELATQNLASGTARLAGALVVFLTITFGILIGQNVAQFLFAPVASDPGEPLAVQLVALSLGVSAIAFAVLFQAKLKDAGWILLAISTAYYGTRLGGAIFAPEAAVWTGAFLLGVVSNLFGRFANRPPAVMLVPGLLLLVPGSRGFFTITALLRQDVQHGIEAAFTMALIAASIVAGLLMANVFVASRRAVIRV
jgi:uncharacterized membrane protein YjjP (DUF1212 family)